MSELCCPDCGRPVRECLAAPCSGTERLMGIREAGDPAVTLLERVLRLRMDGERAAGSGETWAQLERDIERFLREYRGFDEGSGPVQ